MVDARTPVHTYVELGDWDAAERVAAEIPDPDEYGDAGFPPPTPDAP
jgi:hypothetical protein